MKYKLINKYAGLIVIAVILILLQLISALGILPNYILPSPLDTLKAFVNDFSLLLSNSFYTLLSAVIGLCLSIVVGVILAVFMSANITINKAVYPLLVLSQTVPTIAVAPILIIWFGYGLLPKILLVFTTCFFPIVMGVLAGLEKADKSSVVMLQTFGGTKWDIFKHLKLPTALPSFFSAVKVSATYAIISAVVSEWLGGNNGLGVYMTRVRRSYAMDKMFASILFISLVSIALVKLITIMERKTAPWKLYD